MLLSKGLIRSGYRFPKENSSIRCVKLSTMLRYELILLAGTMKKSLTVMTGVLAAGIAMAIRCDMKVGGNLVDIE